MRPLTLFKAYEFFISPSNLHSLYIFYAICIFASILISLIFTLNLSSTSHHKIYPYMQLLDNWEQPFIEDIKITLQDECPVGYSYMVNYKWPGTEPGCDCRHSLWIPENRYGKRMYIDKGFCTVNQTNYGCYDIQSIPGKNFHRWREFKVLCMKQMFGTNFMNSFLMSRYQDECPEGFFKCGGETKDSTYCIPNIYEKCPISSIMIARQKPDPLYNESLLLDDGEKLSIYWSREAPKTPPVEIRVNEEDVCYDNWKINRGSNYEDHVLMVNSKTPCDRIDHRFEPLDALSERKFFQMNQMAYLEEVLPLFQFKLGTNWKIFSRGHITFNIECRPQIKNLFNFRDLAQKINNINENWVALIMIFGFISLFLNIIYAVLTFKKNESLVPFQVATIFINYLARYCCLNYCHLAGQTLGSFQNSIGGLNMQNCSDDLTNDYFKMIQEEDPSFSLSVLKYSNILMILIDIGIFLFVVFILKIKKNENKLY